MRVPGSQPSPGDTRLAEHGRGDEVSGSIVRRQQRLDFRSQIGAALAPRIEDARPRRDVHRNRRGEDFLDTVPSSQARALPPGGFPSSSPNTWRKRTAARLTGSAG